MKDRASEIARNHNYDGHQRALASMVYGSGISVNEQLADELHKPVIKKLKRRKVYARFKENTWVADLAEMNHCLRRIKMLNIYYE